MAFIRGEKTSATLNQAKQLLFSEEKKKEEEPPVVEEQEAQKRAERQPKEDEPGKQDA